MKLIAIKFFLVLTLLTCSTDRGRHLQESEFCDSAYETSEIYFKQDAKLLINLRFVYFADSVGEINSLNFDSLMGLVNDFYAPADIQFYKFDVVEIVNSEIKQDMPSHVKYHLKYFNNEAAITCYIYGDDQPHYIGNKQFVSGSAGGIGVPFFSLRYKYLRSNTILHELGHCLGLYHIDTPDTSDDGYNIQTGDKVCDTPKSFEIHNSVNSECKYVGMHPYLANEKKILTCNIMSYIYHKCRTCLEEGQIDKIRWTLHESGDLRKTIREGLNPEVL